MRVTRVGRTHHHAAGPPGCGGKAMIGSQIVNRLCEVLHTGKGRQHATAWKPRRRRGEGVCAVKHAVTTRNASGTDARARWGGAHSAMNSSREPTSSDSK